MTPTLWIAIYAMVAFIGCAVVYGNVVGAELRWRDEQARRKAERRRMHFRHIALLQAERNRVERDSLTWGA